MDLRRIAVALALAAACKDDPPPPPSGPGIGDLAAIFAAPSLRQRAQVIVEVDAPGWSAVELERQVLEPLEAAFAPHVESIDGVAQAGRVRIYLWLPRAIDIVAAMTELQRAVPVQQLPPELAPRISRADRDGALLFATIERSSASGDQLAALEQRVATQAGIWSVRTCGAAPPSLELTLDPMRLLAYGIAVDDVLDALGDATSGGPHVRDTTALVERVRETSIGAVRVSDVATIAITTQDPDCRVLDGVGHPPAALRAYGTREAIEAAAASLAQDAGVRVWVPGSTDALGLLLWRPRAIDPEGLRVARWLHELDGDAPAFVFDDGSDPVWVLAGPRTSLRSHSAARVHDLHVWWPGAPLPVTVRYCGPELDALVRGTIALAEAMGGHEGVDDVLVTAPVPTPTEVVELARDAPVRPRRRDLVRGLGGSIALGASVRVRLGGSTEAALTAPVRAHDDTLVPLRHLVQVTARLEPELIYHHDRARCADVDVMIADETHRAVLATAALAVPPPLGIVASIVPPE